MKHTFYILLFFLAIQSCDEDNPMPGGPCTYNDYTGTGLVRDIIPDTLNETCGNAMIVYFDFTPDDPNAPEQYKFPMFPDTNQIFHLFGYNPPVSWLDEKGIGIGSEFTCVRKEITSGTCDPHMFMFPNIDGSDWREYCKPPN